MKNPLRFLFRKPAPVTETRAPVIVPEEIAPLEEPAVKSPAAPDRTPALLAENADLKKEIKALSELIEKSKNEKNRAMTRADRAERKVTLLEAQIADLMGRIGKVIPSIASKDKTAPAGSVIINFPEQEKPLYPESFDALEKWAKENHPDTLVILPRAIRSAQKATYHDIQLVYRTLEFFAVEYHAQKVNGTEAARKAAKDKMRDLGINVGKIGLTSGHAENYRVLWRDAPHDMEIHAKRGNSTDPRFCMRVYGLWCDSTKRFVVGHLPSHLPNGLTN